MKSKFGNLRDSQTLDPVARQDCVTDLFDDLAPDYDRFNRWVTMFRDEAWRSQTVGLLGDRVSGVVLDLAAGTGDLASCAGRHGARQVHVFDISRPMLTLAQQKLAGDDGDTGYVFEQGSAHRLPLKSDSINGIVSGFAMRNVFHFLDDVLAEMSRVLKPGGRFAILELSQPRNWILQQGFRIHMKTVMPLIGKLTARRSRPFAYLRETTMSFLSPSEFKQRLEAAGFEQVAWKSFLLGGIAIHHGQKPL